MKLLAKTMTLSIIREPWRTENALGIGGIVEVMRTNETQLAAALKTSIQEYKRADLA